MLSPSQLIVAALGLAVIGTQASPIAETRDITIRLPGPPADGSDALQGTTVYWPESVTVDSPVNKRETNQQRFARGLGPLAPVRRYSPTYQALSPRISPAPQSNTANTYGFTGCVVSGSALTEVHITAQTLQSAVDQCAAVAAGLNPAANNFAVANDKTSDLTSYACFTSVTPSGFVTCSAAVLNYGLYTKI